MFLILGLVLRDSFSSLSLDLGARQNQINSISNSEMSFRYVFQEYINHPEQHQDIIVFEDDNVLIIKDSFPKALRHYLVIPKSPAITKVHPLDVFNRDYSDYTGEELYDLISEYVEKAKTMVAEDLGKVLECEPSKVAEIKNTRIKVGIHSIPSLKNLHIHVITTDFHLSSMKNKKHYNSFNTKFFVEFEELNPEFNEQYLRAYNQNYDSDSADSEDGDDGHSQEFIRHVRNETILHDIIKETPLKCLQCGEKFDFKFQRLKLHLETEVTKYYGSFGVEICTLSQEK